MEKLSRVFLTANAGIEFIEHCTLPYIYLPDAETLNYECCIDVFYILDGTAELMFNKPPSKIFSAGDFIFLKRKVSDCFILSGHSYTDILHAKILPFGWHQDLVMCHGYHENLLVLKKESSPFSPSVAELMKLLLSLREEGRMNLLLEMPVALFLIQLYLAESSCLTNSIHDAEHIFSGLMMDMIKSPGRPWRVKDMAKKYNMNTSVFIIKFRKKSGYTPFCFLKKIRLSRGRKLLEYTDMPVSVIARKCGYNSQASFSFYIKQEFGLSPIKIRKMHERKHEYQQSERE
ncbi:helix-turn-helix transcriptional regulator [Salmonella enterica]|nr:helix-turn-helix transcriptional regulator [Salmonella enterica]EKK6346496.1 helix-turn-helix transcriptional regulator [Salmonella enterica]ELO7821409.1 helix-turn-helix transcriptional regulator [Salmonella enterica]ELR6878425.1 helix-turn-helix transcriptional regulator [Salmonella enterica]MJK42717.1 AraC family transcriptional regulator [Salmonella enterica subsp. diarizonae]